VAQNIKKTPYPHVIFTEDIFDSQTSFTLFADSTEIAVCTDVLTAITACFVVYWIFNIQYPKQFRNFLSFLDIALFRKKSVRTTQRLLTFINKL